MKPVSSVLPSPSRSPSPSPRKPTGDRPRDRRWQRPDLIALAIVVLVGGLVFLWGLGSTGLVDETEPLFAEAARQMTVTGDWIAPYFNGEPRFDKPPLIYWLMAIGYRILGTNEWAARLPSALSGLALMVLLFYVLARFTPPATHREQPIASRPVLLVAVLGATLSALNLLAIVWGRTGVSDMLLSACMGSALLCFFVGYASGGEAAGAAAEFQDSKDGGPSQWYLAFYALLGLAVLAKGPVGVVLPGLTVTAFLLYTGELGQVFWQTRPLRGLALTAAIALPWYVAVTLAYGELYLDRFFGYHNFERFTRVVNEHGAPWYFYFAVVLLGFFPWSAYLPAAIARLRFWQRRRWQATPRRDRLGLFAAFWFAAIFIFFSAAATKLPSYVLPLIPAAAVLVAIALAGEFQQPRSQSLHRSHWANATLSLVFAIALFSLPDWLGYDPAAPDLNDVLSQSGLMVLGASLWLAVTVAVEVAILARSQRWIWYVTWLGFLAFVVVSLHPLYGLLDRQRQLPLRQLATLVQQVRQPQEELLVIGIKKYSLVFYTRSPVVFAPSPPQAIAYGRQNRDRGAASVLVLAQPDRFRRIGLERGEYDILTELGAYRLGRAAKAAIHNPEAPPGTPSISE